MNMSTTGKETFKTDGLSHFRWNTHSTVQGLRNTGVSFHCSFSLKFVWKLVFNVLFIHLLCPSLKYFQKSCNMLV